MNTLLNDRHFKGYNRLIDNALSKNRSKKDDIYYENHHIIPSAFGGKNEKSNMVLLTAKEHYISHYLISKFATHISGAGYHKAIRGFKMMHTISSSHDTRFINACMYEKLKIKYADILTGRKLSDKTKEKIRQANLGKTLSDETKSKISLGLKQYNENNIRKPLSDETKEKIRQANLGKTYSDEVNAKKGLSGNKNPFAKLILIYDNNDNIMFKCYGDFKKVCLDNELPFVTLTKSKSKGGKKIYINSKPKNENFLKYVGWYSKTMNAKPEND